MQLKNDIIISAITLQCFYPASENCTIAIGKNGDFMKEYFNFKKNNETKKLVKLVVKWDQAIVKNSNAKNKKVQIKNFLELRKLPSYKTITKARERWYKEKLAKEPSTTRSGKRYNKNNNYKELQLKF